MNEPETKTCQQCFSDYLPGEGVPEIGGEFGGRCLGAYLVAPLRADLALLAIKTLRA